MKRSWFYHSPKVKLNSYEEYNNLIKELHDKAFFYVPDNLAHRNGMWHDERPKFNVKVVTRVKKNGTEETQIYVFTSVIVDRCIYYLKTGTSGAEALKMVNQIFKENNGISLRKAFGVIKETEVEEFDNYAARSLGYAEPGKYREMSKADISSAYPSAICGRLPDAHDYKVVNGFIEPTKEYPFAFCLKSGHLIIKDELDTRQFNPFIYEHTGRIIKGKFEPVFKPLNDMDEKTILMRASDFELTPEMNYLYSEKNNKDSKLDAKGIMNTFIGRLASIKYNKENYQGHLSVVAYSRHLKKMSDLINSIQHNGGKVKHVIVDCISWTGKMIPECTKQKSLGAFVLEAERVPYMIFNRYKYTYLSKGNWIKKGFEKDCRILINNYKYITEVTENNKTVWRRENESEVF